MKKFLPAILITFSFCFMLFIFEPLTMYANNINDFWFDIYILLKPVLLMFNRYFLSSILFFFLIFIFCKKIIKEYTVYNFLVIVLSILLIVTYIQGNFLSYNLPRLNGDVIHWNSYNTEKVVSIILLVVISCITFYFSYKPQIKCIKCNKKINFDVIINDNSEKVIKFFCCVSIAIFIMLITALIPTLSKEKVLEKKYLNALSTMKNYNVASTNKNFYIILVDSVDSKTFANALKKQKKYKDLFNDFTYYPDTMSGYGYTRNSLPLILSGIWNTNEMNFIDYSNYAFDNSPFFSELINKNYLMNIYDYDLTWSSEKTVNIDNFQKLDRKLTSTSKFNDEISKYISFKYLPYYLKQYSKIETLDFSKFKVKKKYERFFWHDKYNYDIITNSNVDKISKNNFSFFRFEGAHELFDVDSELNYIENGTYKQKVSATIKLISAFINRLKENNVYDNSVIIVMADHGYNSKKNVLKRNNPILYIKGINEHHKLITSDSKISHGDLIDIYQQLLNGALSTDLNLNFDRKRRYLFYEYGNEDHLTEFVTSDKAWEYDKLVKTGKEYNR